MIDENRKAYDDKMNKYYSKLDKQDSIIDNLTAMIKNTMDKNQNSNYLSENVYSPNDQGPTTLVPNKKKSPTMEGVYYTFFDGINTALTSTPLISPLKFLVTRSPALLFISYWLRDRKPVR